MSKQRSRTPPCLFDHNQYPYVWSTTPHKGWTQAKCPRCGLFTVNIHSGTGLKASQCDGVEAFWATWKSILALAKERAP